MTPIDPPEQRPRENSCGKNQRQSVVEDRLETSTARMLATAPARAVQRIARFGRGPSLTQPPPEPYYSGFLNTMATPASSAPTSDTRVSRKP